jgi:hypothetical protein
MDRTAKGLKLKVSSEAQVMMFLFDCILCHGSENIKIPIYGIQFAGSLL